MCTTSGPTHQNSVIELNGCGVLEEIPPLRIDSKNIRRYPAVGHFREGVIYETFGRIVFLSHIQAADNPRISLRTVEL